jgi:hypothetical protein
METVRLYEFTNGAETSTQPDAGTPSAANDLVTKSYADATYVAAPAVTGSFASPSAIVAGTGIAFTGSNYFNLWIVQGSGGAVDVSANPQIAAGTVVGQKLTVVCTSDTNTVKLEHGTGLQMNGEYLMVAGSSITFNWTGATGTWVEESRNGI